MAAHTSTQAHPRIALLVSTITTGWDDMFHFFVLFSIVFFSGGMIARLQFGQDDRNFSTYAATLHTQYQMVTGTMPANWGSSLSMFIYCISFNLVIYFLCLV